MLGLDRFHVSRARKRQGNLLASIRQFGRESDGEACLLNAPIVPLQKCQDRLKRSFGDLAECLLDLSRVLTSLRVEESSRGGIARGSQRGA